MRNKVLNTIGTFIGWFVVVSFLTDIYMFWGRDTERVLFSISGALGWACYLQIRGEYHSFLDMINGLPKNIKDKINDAKS